jgi:hypothetical protein
MKYTKEILETWKTRRLGALYVNVCLDLTEQTAREEELTGELELITGILNSRPFLERAEVLEVIIGVYNRPDQNVRERMYSGFVMSEYLQRVIVQSEFPRLGNRSFFYKPKQE